MQRDYYECDVDFYSMFESDTFDEEVMTDNVFKGYVFNDAGERVLAATLTLDATGGGWGEWDDTVI